MEQPTSVIRRPSFWLLSIVVGGAIFSAAAGQAPLYYSNQNQYFLHGLAAAGEGFLADDWLAQTADPTPVFSLMVRGLAAVPWAFYGVMAILTGVYVAGLMGVFVALVGQETAARRWPIFFLALVVVHAGLFRWASNEWLGLDYPWYLQAGVAGQYVLGGMLQPSVFGVLLVAAIGLFANGFRLTAAVAVALAATVHPTYLLPGAMLTAGFVVGRLFDKDVRGAALQAGLTLALVAPIATYVLWRFQATSAHDQRIAHDVLVNLRIPHHCQVALWLDGVAALQIAWLAASLLLTWRTPLFATLATALTLGAMATLIQMLTESDALALLFPWRISAVLMPVATAAALARLVGCAPVDGRWVVALGASVALAGAGVWVVASGRAFRAPQDELPLYDFVRRDRRPGDLYVLPVEIPKLAQTTRGSVSGDFKSPSAKRADPRLIPIDLQRFRLATGVPIYVDFKSIPYKDVDLVEWRNRLGHAKSSLFPPVVPPVFRAERITHVVVPAGVVPPAAERLSEQGVEEVFVGEAYRVYRLPGRKKTP